jgi:hypothetical protein
MAISVTCRLGPARISDKEAAETVPSELGVGPSQRKSQKLISRSRVTDLRNGGQARVCPGPAVVLGDSRVTNRCQRRMNTAINKLENSSISYWLSQGERNSTKSAMMRLMSETGVAHNVF